MVRPPWRARGVGQHADSQPRNGQKAHRQKLGEYEAMSAADPGSGPRGPWLTLDSGIAHEREWVRFWQSLA